MRLPFASFGKKKGHGDGAGERERARLSQETIAAPSPDPAPASERTPPSPPISDDEAGVRLPLAVVLESLPDELRGSADPGSFPEREVVVSGQIILPQIAQGAVRVPVADLKRQVPDNVLCANPPRGAEIALPLELVIPRIPPEWLELRADQVVVELPEDLQDPFSEDSTPAGETDAAPDTGIVATGAAAVDEPAAGTGGVDSVPPLEQVPLPELAPVFSHDAPRGAVRIPLDSILSSLPDGLVSPKAVERDPDLEIELPLAWIVPQLVKGEIVLTLQRIASALPDALLRAPADDFPVQPIVIPLHLVVDQLSPELFAAPANQNRIDLPDEGEIPVPFREQDGTSDAGDLPITVEPPKVVLRPVDEPPGAQTETTEPVADDQSIPTEIRPLGLSTGSDVDPGSIERRSTAATDQPEAAPASFDDNVPEVDSMAPITGQVPTWSAAPARAERGRLIDGFDVNRCVEQDLVRLPGVGPALAQRIIAFRKERGEISDLYELLKVPGIGKKVFASITGLSASRTGEPVEAELGRLLGLPADRVPRLREVGAACERLDGVEAAAFASRDGLVITGRAGEGLDLERVSAAAPLLLRRMGRYAREVRWGRLRAFTIVAKPKSLTAFPARNLLLLVAHEPGGLSAETMDRLQAVVDASSRSCTRRLILEDRSSWR